MILDRNFLLSVSDIKTHRFPSGMTATIIKFNPEFISWLNDQDIKLKTKKFETELTKAKLVDIEKTFILFQGYTQATNTHTIFLKSNIAEEVKNNINIELKMTKKQHASFIARWCDK